MIVNTKNSAPLSETNRNYEVEAAEEENDEDIMAISAYLIEQNRKAYEVLAK